MARNQLAPNSLSLNDLWYQSFVLAADGKPALAVVNTDGTSISAGGGGGGTQYTDGQVAVANPIGNALIYVGSDGNNKAVGRSQGLPISFAEKASATATWTTATALNTALSLDCQGFGTVVITSVETGTTTTAGALTFEGFDGTNWWPLLGQQTNSYTVQSNYSLVNGTNVAWSFEVQGFQQFRVRLSTAITGTGSPQVVLLAQPEAEAVATTPTVGWAHRLDNVNDSVTSYPFGNSYQNITTNATTTLKSGAGVFKGFTVNNNGFTTAGTITIYDNTAASGTKLGTITIPVSPPGTALLATDLMPPALGFDAAFTTGLTFVTATTAPAADITVIWR